MAENLIKDWISEFKVLTSTEVHSFANITVHNHDLIQVIITALEEKKYHQELLHLICEQLFSFFRSDEDALHIFTLQFLPSLISLYLTVSAAGKQKSFGCVETLLLGIYNLGVLNKDGKSTMFSFRIPSTTKPSIYHEPFGSSHTTLTENALNRLEFGDNRTVTIGPYHEVEKLNASNRLLVMKVLMQVYNRHISLMSKISHQALCRTFSRVVRQGTGRQRSSLSLDIGSVPYLQSLPRILLSSDLLLEVLYGIYYSMFNGLHFPGIQSLDDIHYRATLELMPDVLLVTNAVRNSLKTNPSGQPTDGPMGISLALSPTASSTVISKTIITNASFRTKKLPDDIPIQIKDDGSVSDSKQHLASISEEFDDDQSVRTNSVKGNKIVSSKLPTLQLRKNKEKKKEVIKGSSKEPGLKSSLKVTPTYAAKEPDEGIMVTSFSRVSLDSDSKGETTYNENSTKKSNSAFNVSSPVSNHIGASQESVSKKESENGMSKYPSAQTVL